MIKATNLVVFAAMTASDIKTKAQAYHELFGQPGLPCIKGMFRSPVPGQDTSWTEMVLDEWAPITAIHRLFVVIAWKGQPYKIIPEMGESVQIAFALPEKG